MNIKLSALVASVTFSLTIGSVAAIAGGPIQKMDKNGDGVLSMDEFKGPDNRFKKMDKDGDGKLTEAELKEARRNNKKSKENRGDGKNNQNRKNKQRRKPVTSDQFFENRDKNKDGKLDKKEVPQKNFDKLDKNHDGYLSKEEVDAMPRFMSPEEKKAAAGNRWFNNRDKDGDGSLTRVEFYGEKGDPFSRLDKNNDGKISKEEAQARAHNKNRNKKNRNSRNQKKKHP